jgi:tetratricopeptide (TPR) repeat protein
MRLRFVVGFLFVLALLTPHRAHARPSKATTQQLAQAKAAFNEATVAYDAGHFDVALKGFEHAHELSRNPILFFNMAACSEKLGELRVAAAYLRTYLSEVPQADDAEKVRERIGALEDRAQQTDKRRVEEEQRAEDEARRQKEAQAREAELAAQVTTTPAPPPPQPVGRRYLGGFAALGATAVLGIVAAGVGGSTIVKFHDLNASCGAAGCGSRVDPVHTQAIVADAFIGLAGAAAVTTVVLFALEARHHRGAR